MKLDAEQSVIHRRVISRFLNAAVVSILVSAAHASSEATGLHEANVAAAAGQEMHSLPEERLFRTFDVSRPQATGRVTKLTRRGETGVKFFRVNMIPSSPASSGLESPEITPPPLAQNDELLAIANDLKRRDFDKALAEIDVLIKKQPANIKAFMFQGMAHAGKHDVRGARQSFERALQIDPGYFPATAGLVTLDLEENKPADAEKRIQAILAKDPRNLNALLASAEVRAKLSAPTEEVAGILRKAIAANPNALQPRMALVRYYRLRNEPAKAVDAAQEAVSAMPSNPDLLEALGSAQFAMKQPAKAVATFERLSQVKPDSARPQLLIGEVRLAEKDYKAALTSFRKGLAIDPNSLEAQRAIVLTNLASDRFSDAVLAAKEIEQKRPTESVGYVMLANVYATKKQWNDAVDTYRRGLKQAPGSDLAIGLHAALRSEGDTAQASEWERSWLKDHANDNAFRLYLAEVALQRKEYPEAATQYRRVLETQPENLLALNNLAWVAGQMKDPRAIEYAEKANTLAPGRPSFMDTLGVLLVERGDTKRGIDLLQRAVTLAPGAPGIRLNLSKALLKAGRKDEAKKELSVLANLGDKYPEHAEVAELMKGL